MQINFKECQTELKLKVFAESNFLNPKKTEIFDREPVQAQNIAALENINITLRFAWSILPDWCCRKSVLKK
jgi:hypothetical protein